MSTARGTWWERLEVRRGQRKESVKVVAETLGVSPQTLYNYRDSAAKASLDFVRALSTYLGDQPSQLWAELTQQPDEGMDAMLRSHAAREMNAVFRQSWHSTVAEVLDPVAPAEVELIDIVFRRLRKAMPECSFDIRLQYRGQNARQPFQFAIHIGHSILHPNEIRENIRQVLVRLRVAASFEHSIKLLPEEWQQDGFPVVLVPVHLAPRVADWMRNTTGPFNALVLGVWYSGAPDIAAEIAKQLYAGFDIITSLAAIAGSWDPGSSRSDLQLERQQTFLAQRITADPSPYAGPFVWSNGDVPPILDERVKQQLVDGFDGPLIISLLDDNLLAYAAYRSSTATGAQPGEHVEALRNWQDQLRELAHSRISHRKSLGKSEMTMVETLALPVGVVADGEIWADQVDAMFDSYIAAAGKAVAWIRSSIQAVGASRIS